MCTTHLHHSVYRVLKPLGQQSYNFLYKSADHWIQMYLSDCIYVQFVILEPSVHCQAILLYKNKAWLGLRNKVKLLKKSNNGKIRVMKLIGKTIQL